MAGNARLCECRQNYMVNNAYRIRPAFSAGLIYFFTVMPQVRARQHGVIS